MQISRTCKLKDHQAFPATHLCIARDCKLQVKWCCIQCVKQGVHQHGKTDQDHIEEWKETIRNKREEVFQFQKYFIRHNLYCKHNLLSQGLQQCNKMVQILKEYSSFLVLQIQSITKSKLKFKEIDRDLNEDKFFLLQDERVCELLNFNKNDFVNNTNLLIKPIQQINQNLIQLERQIQDYKELWIRTEIFTDIKDIKYQMKEVDQIKGTYNTSQISNNEQFLAYGGDDDIIKIYDIKQERVVSEIKLDSQIYSSVCRNLKGYVYGFGLLNYFKQIFKKQIHLNRVCDIRTILTKYFITYSNDRSIIKTDIITKQQIFKFEHTENIISIDYNQIDDMIISGSQDKSLLLWDCSHQKIIINKQQSHPQQVRQIQFINKNQNLLSLDSSHNLFKWKIDLIIKDLIKIQAFTDHRIYNFYQINYNQILFLICLKQIKILDYQGKIIHLIDHQAGEFDSWISDCRQVESGRYIQVRSQRKIQLAEALN